MAFDFFCRWKKKLRGNPNCIVNKESSAYKRHFDFCLEVNLKGQL
jgi:hypothetical protein